MGRSGPQGNNGCGLRMCMVSTAQTPLSLSRPGVSNGRALPSSWFSFGAGVVVACWLLWVSVSSVGGNPDPSRILEVQTDKLERPDEVGLV